MTDIAALVVDNIDIWTGAIQRKSGAGRGGSKRISLYGIERLRALIIDLAVRGKLVPQDAGDEPASELLKGVKVEQAKLIKSKTIGKGRAFAPVSQTPPFEIPSNWIWTQISEIGHDWGQREPSSAFTYIDVGSIDQTLGVLQSPNVVAANDAPSRARKVVRKGTVLYSTVRPYLLNIAIVDKDFDPEPIASTAFAVIHPFAGIEAGFIYRYLRSATFVSYVESCQTGIAYPAINDRQFFAAWCPLPPLAEQRRIVAKVDKLMALCDALERESADAMAAHQALVEALLATLVNSADAADLARHWARLESHFDILFTIDASIDALKQTILDLAVRGKLVEQNARDETADKLLVAAKKTSIKGSSKAKFHPPIKPQDQPFRLPASWQWERFDNLIQPDMPIAYGVLVPGDDQADGIPFVRIADLSITDPPVLPEKAISPKVDAQYERTRIKGGEILMGVVGSIGKLGVAPPSWAGANIARAICRIVPASFMDRSYVLWLLQSRFMQDSFKGDTRTLAQPTLNLTLIRLAATPVPPLAEQRRIVAKVDALMALCDALKARLADAAQTQRHLADAITERAAA